MSTYVDRLNGNYSPPAESVIQTGWSTADSRATAAFGLASSLMGAVANVDIPFEAITSGFTAPAISYTLSLPEVPAAPTVVFPALTDPGDLVLAGVDEVVPGDVPVFSAVVPVVQILDKPDALSATAPGDAPLVSDVTIPDAPVIVFPTDPTLQLISIPAAPTLALPVWTGVAPDGTSLVVPTTGFVWSEDYYDSALLGDVTGRLTTMLLGGTGLPAAIEQAIWDRGRAREDVAAIKATQETYEEFSARGFMLPTGALAGRVAEVWQKNHEASSTFSRDVAIKQAELEVENLKFSVATGMQLEGQLMTYSGQYAQRALDAAKVSVQVAIDIFNAQVALYNARLQAYQTEAQVYKELIQAESLRLEQYRTEIEAQKLVGDINIQAIQIYSERIKALLAAVELYKAQLDGVKTVVEVDRTRIEGFRATVDAYKSEVEAKTSEYQAWSESIKGETAKVSIYEAQARSYATLVDAYKTGETVKIENLKSQIDARGLDVKVFSERVNYLAEQVKAGVAQVDSSVKVYDGQSRVYSAQIGGEQARVQALAEQIRLIIAAGSTDADLKLRAAGLNVEQLIRTTTLEQEGLKSAGAAAAQLAASAMSAFNLSASVSSGWSLGVSNSLGESHNLTT